MASTPIRLSLVVDSPTSATISGVEALADSIEQSIGVAADRAGARVEAMAGKIRKSLANLTKVDAQGFSGIQQAFTALGQKLDLLEYGRGGARGASGGIGAGAHVPGSRIARMFHLGGVAPQV